MDAVKSSPLLSVGNFGTHLVKGEKSYFFAGTIPTDLKGGYQTEQEGISAFVSWFTSQPTEFQREHIGNLRNDIFSLVIESSNPK
jgi:hypothetical protein